MGYRVVRNELYHHGIMGMKWGVRRFQNKDGSYTAAGRARYGYSKDPSKKMSTTDKGDSSVTRKVKADYNNLSDKDFMAKYKASKKTYAKRVDKYGDPYMNSPAAKLGKKLSAKNTYKKDKKKAYNEFNNSIKELQKSGKGRNIEEIVKLSTAYDMSLKQAKEKYKRRKSEIDGIIKNNYNKKLVNEMTYDELNNFADLNQKNRLDKFIKPRTIDNEFLKETKKYLTYNQKAKNGGSTTTKSNQSSPKVTLTEAANKAFKDHPNLTYSKIYKEMGVDMKSEDPDDYRDAEFKWMKKHGYM